jgi:hypothetical protein
MTAEHTSRETNGILTLRDRTLGDGSNNSTNMTNHTFSDSSSDSSLDGLSDVNHNSPRLSHKNNWALVLNG